MSKQDETRFEAGREMALSALQRASVVASDEPGVRIEGMNSYRWVFRCDEVVVHHAAPTRGACVVHEIMDGHRPAVWLSDRYPAQQGGREPEAPSCKAGWSGECRACRAAADLSGPPPLRLPPHPASLGVAPDALRP